MDASNKTEKEKEAAVPSQASKKEIDAIKGELRKILENEANDDMTFRGTILHLK